MVHFNANFDVMEQVITAENNKYKEFYLFLCQYQNQYQLHLTRLDSSHIIVYYRCLDLTISLGSRLRVPVTLIYHVTKSSG